MTARRAMKWFRPKERTAGFRVRIRCYAAPDRLSQRGAFRFASQITRRCVCALVAAEAYAIASMGVDFRVAEAVDSVQLIYGIVPKKFFKQNSSYWTNK